MTFAAAVVVGVLAFVAVLGWALLRSATVVERVRQDPGYRWRFLAPSIAITGAGAVFLAVQLVSGEPLRQMFFLAFCEVMNIISVIRLARTLKAPPRS